MPKFKVPNIMPLLGIALIASVVPAIIAKVVIAMKPKGHLIINTSPPGATILLNDNTVGTSPVVIDVDPGSYAIIARLTGYSDARSTATIASGETQTISIALVGVEPTPAPAPVSIVSASASDISAGQAGGWPQEYVTISAQVDAVSTYNQVATNVLLYLIDKSGNKIGVLTTGWDAPNIMVGHNAISKALNLPTLIKQLGNFPAGDYNYYLDFSVYCSGTLTAKDVFTGTLHYPG